MALPATLRHTVHPNHQLSLVTTTGWFICDACNQYGKGSEPFYRCEPCNFTVHPECVTGPAVVEHTLFVGSKFTLIESHTTQNGHMSCQACGGETVGFRYFNADPYLYLHPCCAVLPTLVVQDDRVFHLLKDSSVTCGICKDKSQSSLSYRASYDDGEHLYLHVPCLVSLHKAVAGSDNWRASAPIVPGLLGFFARTRITGTSTTPTSSAAAVVATVTHELHPEHKLSPVDAPPSGYKCNVCNGWGLGSQHYRCVPCNFKAHPECATAPATLKHVNCPSASSRTAAPSTSATTHLVCAASAKTSPRRPCPTAPPTTTARRCSCMCAASSKSTTTSPVTSTGWRARPSGRACWGASLVLHLQRVPSPPLLLHRRRPPPRPETMS